MRSSKVSRRQFISSLSAAGGTATVLLPDLAAAAQGRAQPGKSARTSPASAGKAEGNTYPVLGYKRMILDYHFSEFNPLTLKNANTQEIVDAMAKLGIDSLLLYSKDHWGNVYHRSAFSKRHQNVPQDLFGEVLEGLKKHGIRTIAYTTVCWDEDSARKHPDWRVQLKQGPSIFPLPEGPDVRAKWTFLCLNTPYRDYFLRQADELIANYDFPALFLDIVFHHRAIICYCPYCQNLWKQKYGREIPEPMQATDYARYLDFQKGNFERFFTQVREVGRKYNKQFMMTHNFGLTYRYDDYVAMEFDTHGVDFYHPTTRAKLYRARARGKEVELIGHRFNQNWDFTVKPYQLMRYEVTTAIAHNCAMMYVDQPNLDGSLDPQVYETLKKGFVAADDLLPQVKGTVPYAEIALLSSERSFEFDYVTYRDFAGAYEMLTQLHWPFDVITEEALNERELAKFRVLVVPNIVHLSAAQAEAVRHYVERGGNLLFCYRAATLDENARELAQPSFGLVKINRESDNQVSFIKPGWKLSSRTLRVTPVTIIEPRGDWKVLGTLVNPGLRVTATEWISHNMMPGEETSQPTMVRGQVGKGNFVYYAFRLFDEYVAQAVPAMREVFEQGMREFYHPELWVEAPSMVEAIFNRFGNEVRIVLNNGIHSKTIAGDMWAGEDSRRGHTTLAEVVPVHNLAVKVRGRAVAEAFDLKGRPLNVRQTGGVATISVPVLEQYEVVRFRRA